MAEGDFTLYNYYKGQQAQANVDLVGATVKCMLVAGYTPNIDTHQFRSDVNANEVALTNYTAGGLTLTTKAVSVNNGANRAEWDFDDVVFALLGAGAVSHAILYVDTGNASTSVLIGYVELTKQPNGANYSILVGANGALHFV